MTAFFLCRLKIIALQPEPDPDPDHRGTQHTAVGVCYQMVSANVRGSI